MPLWVQHIVALFRGGHAQIASELVSAARRFEAHAKYKENVANALREKAIKADAKADDADVHADHAFRVATKLGDLLS